MTTQTAVNQQMHFLLTHNDPEVRKAAAVVNETQKRRRRILDLVQEALSQLRVDMKYLLFDLECTRRERDAAQAKLKDEN